MLSSDLDASARREYEYLLIAQSLATTRLFVMRNADDPFRQTTWTLDGCLSLNSAEGHSSSDESMINLLLYTSFPVGRNPGRPALRSST